MSKNKIETIFGMHAVESVLKNDPANILQFWIEVNRNDKRIKQLVEQIKKLGLPIEYIKKKDLENRCDSKKTQGIALRYRNSGEVKSGQSLEDIIKKEFKKTKLDLKKIGELMNGHHAVLRDLLKITVPRIDDMIDAALEAGAYGAKIVGSGGGGSIVAIAEPENEEQVIKAIKAAGAKEAYSVSVDPGARIL